MLYCWWQPTVAIQISIGFDSKIMSPNKGGEPLIFVIFATKAKQSPDFWVTCGVKGDDDDCFNALSDTFKRVIYAA